MDQSAVTESTTTSPAWPGGSPPGRLPVGSGPASVLGLPGRWMGCAHLLRDGTQKQMNGGQRQDTALANSIYDYRSPDQVRDQGEANKP